MRIKGRRLRLLRRLKNFIVALVAFVGAGGLLELYKDREQYHLILWGAGFGSVVIAWFLLDWVIRRLGKRWTKDFTQRCADPSESRNVWQVCRNRFYDRDDQVVNVDSLQVFMEASPNTVRVFEKDNQVVGMAIVFAVNTRAMKDILSGAITSAQELGKLHAAKTQPRALYVTNICAGPRLFAKAFACRELFQDLASRMRKEQTIQWIFARKGSRDGERLLDRYEFEKIDPDAHDLQIWKLSRLSFLAQVKAEDLEEL